MKLLHQRFNQFQGRIKSIVLALIILQPQATRSQNKSHSFTLLKQGVLTFIGKIIATTRKMASLTYNQSILFQQKIKSNGIRGTLKTAGSGLVHNFDKLKSIGATETMELSQQRFLHFIHKIKSLGFTKSMDDYEKRKLGIFNLLNFLQLLTGITVSITGLFDNEKLPGMAWFIASMPSMISILVLTLNSYRKYEAALISYFILYPVITSIVYMSGLDLGVELFFILYGILSVFFLQQISHMIFSVGLSMISYFVLSVVWEKYQYQLETANLPMFLFNQVLAIMFIFYGLFLIKKENSGYQFSILSKNRDLHKKNLEIQKQKTEIAEKATLLEKQTDELTQLNTLKNKLFSVIAHDLKTPMYALRNLFRNMYQFNLSGEEIKTMIPDVVNDLNYTTGLMENLLHWAKSQMQSDSIRPQKIDVSKITEEVLQLLRLQAESKKIYIESKVNSDVFVFADKDMINLVLRNLLSNAIKFTPEQGYIQVGVNELSSFVEVFVRDTGTGMSDEAMQKIRKNDYFTTKGTASESGTGLGLMLCKEFLAKNGGQMHIESEPGKGSVFSFTLPRCESGENEIPVPKKKAS